MGRKKFFSSAKGVRGQNARPKPSGSSESSSATSASRSKAKRRKRSKATPRSARPQLPSVGSVLAEAMAVAEQQRIERAQQREVAAAERSRRFEARGVASVRMPIDGNCSMAESSMAESSMASSTVNTSVAQSEYNSESGRPGSAAESLEGSIGALSIGQQGEIDSSDEEGAHKPPSPPPPELPPPPPPLPWPELQRGLAVH